MEKFYTPEEIAEQLKINSQTVLSYIRDGKLPALKLEKGYRISESDFKKFLHGSRVAKSPEDYFLQLGYQDKYKAFRKTSMKPVNSLINPIPKTDIEKILEESSVNDKQGYRAFPFPTLSIMSENTKHLTDGVLLEKEISFAGDTLFFAFASFSGEVLTAESLWEDTANSQFPNSIGLLTSIGIMYRGLLFLSRYYGKLLYTDDVDYAFIIDNPAGRKLAMDSNRGGNFWSEYIAVTEDPIIIERKVNISITPEKAQEITLDMVKEFLWYFKVDLSDEVIKSRMLEVIENVNS